MEIVFGILLLFLISIGGYLLILPWWTETLVKKIKEPRSLSVKELVSTLGGLVWVAEHQMKALQHAPQAKNPAFVKHIEGSLRTLMLHIQVGVADFAVRQARGQAGTSSVEAVKARTLQVVEQARALGIDLSEVIPTVE